MDEIKEWVTVQEYVKLTGRNKRSVYRSISRGTLNTKKNETGDILVNTASITDTEPDSEPDNEPIKQDQEKPTNKEDLVPVYSQEYVDLLKDQINSLKADVEYFKQVHAAALMLSKNASVNNQQDYEPIVPASEPVQTPEEPKQQMQNTKLTRWQHLVAFFKGD